MEVLTIIKDIISITTLTFRPISGLRVWVKARKTTISWSDLELAVERLYKKMADDRYRPESIICLGRAGCIAGSMLSNRFRKPVIPIVVLIYDYQPIKIPHSKRRHRKEILLDCCTLKDGLQNVLVFGIDIMTGNTMNSCLAMLEDKDIAEPKTACLYWNEDAIIHPDYYVEKKERRLQYPWTTESFNSLYNL